MRTHLTRFTMNIPIEVTSVSRNVDGGHYSRKIADISLPILNQLHGVDRSTPQSQIPQALKEATAVLLRGHWIEITLEVMKDGNLKLVSS